MHLSWPQWYETRNQQQQENWKIHVYVEIKEHILNNQWTKEEVKKILTQMKTETQYPKTYGLLQKQFRGKLIVIKAYSKKKRKILSKPSYFTSEETRKLIFELRSEGSGYLEEEHLGRRNTDCKGPDPGACLKLFCDRQEASVTVWVRTGRRGTG